MMIEDLMRKKITIIPVKIGIIYYDVDNRESALKQCRLNCKKSIINNENFVEKKWQSKLKFVIDLMD